MSAVRHEDVLFRAGGVCLQKYGRPWWRGPYDRNEPDTYTFTRADATTCATFVDADLTIRTAAAGKLRCSWYDTDSDGVADVCGLLLESSRANLCLQSEGFATTWSDIGTPTLSAGALTCGALSLALLGDNDGAASEGKRQTGLVTTGTDVKAFSIFVSKGASAAAGGSAILVVDTTAGANRLDATLTWSGTAPSVAMTTGTLLRTVRLASNVYRLEFQTTSCTTGNSHRIDLFPASTAAQQGDLYVGGVQFENAPYPSSYIKTTTVAVTRAADALSFPIGFPPPASGETITAFTKLARPAWAGLSLNTLGVVPFMFDIGGAVGASTTLVLSSGYVDGQLTAIAQTDATYRSQASAATPAGATISVAVQAKDFGATPEVRLDVGSGFGSWDATETTSATVWYSNTIAPGGIGGGPGMDGLLLDLIVLRGAFTLAECAATPTP